MTTALHPGEVLRGIKSDKQYSIEKLARFTGVPIERLNKILNATVLITLTEANSFALIFGASADYWMDLQRKHNAFKAEEKRSS